jgi:hypothetical protein
MLPPGRARLGTSPATTGSAVIATIGIVVVIIFRFKAMSIDVVTTRKFYKLIESTGHKMINIVVVANCRRESIIS